MTQQSGTVEPIDVARVEREYDTIVKDEILWLPRAAIDPDPEQVRTVFDPAKQAELRASIEAEGLKEILTVRPHPEDPDRFMIVNGERRWRATEGLAQVRPDAPAGCLPCVLTLAEEDGADRLVSQYLQNTGEQLTPIEQARLFKRLMEEHGLSQAEVARRLGVPRSTVGDRARVADLPEAWTALLDAGKLAISQAVEVTKFSGLPEAAHRRVITRLQSDYRYRVQGDNFSTLQVKEFREAIALAYLQAACYPIDQKGQKPWDSPYLPAATIKQHDAECRCGRVVHSGVDYCGNPEWWEPEVKAARAAAKEREEKATAKKLATRETGIALPTDDARVVPWNGYGTPPKGYIVLTKGKRWAVDNWGRLAFDPDDLTIDESKLARWKSEYSRDEESEGVLTSDIAAVKAAHVLWAERWGAKEAELAMEARARLREAMTSYPLPLPSVYAVRQLLLALIPTETSKYITEKIAGQLVELAQLLDVGVGEPLVTALQGGKGDRIELARTWLQQIAPADLLSVASAFAASAVQRIQSPADLLEAEQRAVLREIAGRKTPWAEAPGVYVEHPCDVCGGELAQATEEEQDMAVHRACDPQAFADDEADLDEGASHAADEVSHDVEEEPETAGDHWDADDAELEEAEA